MQKRRTFVRRFHCAVCPVHTKKIPHFTKPAFWTAVLLRRASVLAGGQNLGAGGIHFRRAFESPKGGAGQQPAKPKKKDTLNSVSFFLVEARGVEPLSENASTGTSPGADGYLHSLTQA